MEYHIGDRVVPFRKTALGPLCNSGNWKCAQAIGQGYLYVMDIYRDEDRIIGSCRRDKWEKAGCPAMYALCWEREPHGDYFFEGDFGPYAEPVTPDEFYEGIGFDSSRRTTQ